MCGGRSMWVASSCSPLKLLPQFGSDRGENFVVSPGGGRVGFLMVIGFQDEIASREKNFLDFGILAHLLPGRRYDQTVMLARLGRTVLDLRAFEGDPVDSHLLHVFFSQRA